MLQQQQQQQQQVCYYFNIITCTKNYNYSMYMYSGIITILPRCRAEAQNSSKGSSTSKWGHGKSTRERGSNKRSGTTSVHSHIAPRL